MANFSNQLPQGVPFIDKRNMVDYRWVAVLNRIASAVAPTGVGFVVDGSAESYAGMTLFQGPETARPATPTTGSIYFALDTGKIFWASGGSWVQLDTPLTGDVSKPAGSDVVTLNTVNLAPGTWGGPLTIPVISVNGKGLVTNVTTETISLPSGAPGGPDLSVQFNSGGNFGGAAALTFNPGTQTLGLVNGVVSGALTFVDPEPTFNNLSPLNTVGDLLAYDGVSNVRVPVGSDGQVLTADSAEPTGVKWTSPAATGDNTTPYYIPEGETFVNNLYRQNLFNTAIVVDGTLEINGLIIEV